MNRNSEYFFCFIRRFFPRCYCCCFYKQNDTAVYFEGTELTEMQFILSVLHQPKKVNKTGKQQQSQITANALVIPHYHFIDKWNKKCAVNNSRYSITDWFFFSSARFSEHFALLFMAFLDFNSWQSEHKFTISSQIFTLNRILIFCYAQPNRSLFSTIFVY